MTKEKKECVSIIMKLDRIFLFLNLFNSNLLIRVENYNERENIIGGDIIEEYYEIQTSSKGKGSFIHQYYKIKDSKSFFVFYNVKVSGSKPKIELYEEKTEIFINPNAN